MNRIISAWLALGMISLLCLSMIPMAQANELQEISTLYKQGQHAAALSRVNNYISSHPKDAQARFMKGLILSDQNNPSEAIGVFFALTQDYPQLPEPYNNLAVLYASQGQYEKAKTALEMAIQTHSSYSIAHENLGGIYAKMASQAYDKALQLDKSNSTVQTKLSMIRELVPTGATRSNMPPARLEPAKPTVALAANTVPGIAPPTPIKKSVAPSVIATAKPSIAEPEAPAKAIPTEVKQPSQADISATVLEALNSWAKVWSQKNSKAYLSFYAKDFKTPGGEARAKWEATRRERIAAPKSIQIAIVAPKITLEGSTHATATFKQLYRSDTLKTSTRKTLVLDKHGNKWLIAEERVTH